MTDDTHLEIVQWEGRLFELLHLNKTLFEALQKHGLTRTQAAWWLARGAIRFRKAGGEDAGNTD